MLPEMRKAVLTAVLSAGGLATLVIALGRLWTTAYYDVFGLPTSDLQLTTEDYAFRAKEVLLMITIAVVVAVGLWWHYHHREPPGNGGDASQPEVAAATPAAEGSESGGKEEPARSAGTGERARQRESRRALLVAGLGGGLLLIVFILVELTAMTAVFTPTTVTIALGFVVGAVAGCLALVLTLAGKWDRIGAFVILVVLVAVYLPAAVVQLARESAMYTMETRALVHAVIEFEEQAPASIRRSDDPASSVRVYVVLLTPERMAVALPYPCRQVTGTGPREVPLDDQTFGASAAASDVCDTVVFDRDQVTSIRVLGTGGRPSNDEPDQADEVDLAAEMVNGEVRTRTVYRQAFDFAEARSLSVVCPGGSPGADDRRVRGVWLRLAAREPGWVSVDGGPDRMLRLVVTEPETCQDPAADRFRVTPGRDQLIYLYAPHGDRSLDVRTVTVRFTPVATTVELAEPSLLRVAVEIAATTDPCHREHPAPPQVAAPGVAPEPSECEHDPATRTATYSYRPEMPAPPGAWQVLICSGDEQVTALRVTASPVGVPGENGSATSAEDPGGDPDRAGGAEDELEAFAAALVNAVACQ